MSLGQNDNAILKLLADEQLRKENAALAAENERLKENNDIKRQVIERLKSEVLHLGSIADCLTEVADEMILRHPADCDLSAALESIKKEREI